MSFYSWLDLLSHYSTFSIFFLIVTFLGASEVNSARVFAESFKLYVEKDLLLPCAFETAFHRTYRKNSFLISIFVN